MTPIAKFLVEDTFHLYQRGIVLIGVITEGFINIGNHIIIYPDNIIEIKGIEDVREQDRITLVNLRIGDVIISKADLDKIKGQTLTIIS